MEIDFDGQLQDFEDADHGDLLVARIGNNSMVRGMKAFFPAARGPVDQFVTLGPFTDDDAGAPGVYDLVALRGRVLLNITQSFQFSVSFDPVDLLFDLPNARQSIGLALIGRDRVLLGVKVFRGGGGAWETMFLNLSSGRIEGDPHYADVFASKRWRLIRPQGEERDEPLHEFEWTAEENG